MAMEITQLLLAAQAPEGQVRAAAETNLKQFEEQNYSHFLLALSIELSSEQKPPESRRLAGIILKNHLDAKDSTRKKELSDRWVSIDAMIKAQIKDSLLRTLEASVSEAWQTSSQVIAKVSSIEIPRQEWPDLISHLLNNIIRQDASASLIQATLEAMGYICEEVSPQNLEQNQVNAVLTAVVQGMSQASHSAEVRLSAVRALYNALDFAETNFYSEMERNYIMEVVCKTAGISKELEIRRVAFACLVSIASSYYESLEPYMQNLFNLTANAIRNDEEPVALQAIEFWSSICDVEIEEAQEPQDRDEDDSCESHLNIIKMALVSLVPLLLETLLKQEEDQIQDDGAWNLSLAGGSCLSLVANTVGDPIVPLVMPFVEGNISKADWRSREAATFAFASILDGPSVEQLSPFVHSGLDFLLNAMRDTNTHVKDTTAWTLVKVFEILHSCDSPVLTAANLPRVMSVLLESINDHSAHVSERVCGAIYSLAQGYEDAGSNSSLLTPYIADILSALLSTADRDPSNFKLQTVAYETLNEIVRCGNISETSNMIAQLLSEIMSRLSKTFYLHVLSSDDIEKQSNLQAMLCGVLQVIIQKFNASNKTKPIVLQYADQIMILFLQVFGCRGSTVHEEAMLATGALAYATGPEFEKYMPEFYKYLELGLQNFEEYQVCSVSVGVIGDICSALDAKILPYCDGIINQLLKDLSNSVLHRSVKPRIFSCFGDIALAIDEHFEKYIPYVMPMLQGASELCSESELNDREMQEYGNQLRQGIFEAYSGILQGFKSTKAELMYPYASHVLKFVEAVAKDIIRDEEVSKAAVAVIGDLADTLGPNTKALFQDCTIHMVFLVECIKSSNDQLKQTANWTHEMLQRVMVSS